MPNPNVIGNEVQASEIHAEALRLRREGHILQDIADQLGVSVYAVWKWCKKYADQVTEEARKDARIMFVRDWDATEALLGGYIEKAVQGDVEAASLCVKLLERRSKYMGLDAATKHDVNVKSVPSRDDFDAELIDTIEKLEALERANGAAGDDSPVLGELDGDFEDDEGED